MGRYHIFSIALLALFAADVCAHETDQYSVPVGREFAELGPYFSEAFHDVLDRAVVVLNRQISATLDDGKATAATERWYAPETVARTAYQAMPMWLTWVEPLESRLLSAQLRARYPGRVTVHQPPAWIYGHWALVLDPTKLPRLVRCGTIMVDGVEFGTDKMMHFAHMGFYYMQTYYRARAAGKSEAQATQAAIDLGTGSNPFLSEATWLGLIATGVWSNSDLVVNYLGMLFFRNLTEPVRVRNELLPPMLVRDGAFWRTSDSVRSTGAPFRLYVSDHWNEVFNLNGYTLFMDGFVRGEVRKRCAHVTDWYRDRHLNLRSRSAFLERITEVSTYYGVDYGYRGKPAELVSVITACTWPDEPSEPPRRANVELTQDVDALGRTALWWAAFDCEADRVAELLAAGADARCPDVDGETPLHAAARANSAAIIASLVGANADVNARSIYGTTPLHVAARAGYSDVVGALLAAGADPNSVDEFECTPLEDAAVRGRAAVVELLLAAGADPHRARFGGDLSARTRRAGHVKIAKRLAAHEDPSTMNGAKLCGRAVVGAALLGALVPGCSQGRPLAAWRAAVNAYVAASGDDPACLRDLRDIQSPRGLRPGRITMGVLDVPGAAGRIYDVQGVLVGARTWQNRLWYVFAVGVTQRSRGLPRRIADVRVAAFTMNDDELHWRTGQRDRDALRRYVQWRRGDDRPIAFPGPADAFEAAPRGELLAVTERGSSATWVLAPQDNPGDVDEVSDE